MPTGAEAIRAQKKTVETKTSSRGQREDQTKRYDGLACRKRTALLPAAFTRTKISYCCHQIHRFSGIDARAQVFEYTGLRARAAAAAPLHVALSGLRNLQATVTQNQPVT